MKPDLIELYHSKKHGERINGEYKGYKYTAIKHVYRGYWFFQDEYIYDLLESCKCGKDECLCCNTFCYDLLDDYDLIEKYQEFEMAEKAFKSLIDTTQMKVGDQVVLKENKEFGINNKYKGSVYKIISIFNGIIHLDGVMQDHGREYIDFEESELKFV